MTVYIVTRKSDGVEVYRYSYDFMLEFEHWPSATHNQTELAVPPPPEPPPPVPVKITKLAFRNRFTALEKAKLEIASLHNWALAPDAPSNLVAGSLRASMADQRDAEHIDLSRADTRSGVEVLPYLGLLDPARPAVILDTPPTEMEAWNG